MSRLSITRILTLAFAASLATGVVLAGKPGGGTEKTGHHGGQQAGPVWPGGALGPENYLLVHGVALKAEDDEVFKLVVMGLPASSGKSKQTSGTAGGAARFGGMLNIAGENVALVDLKLEFEGKAQSKDGSDPTTGGRVVGIECQLVRAPIVEGKFADAVQTEIASGKPDKSSIIGTLTGKIVPKRAARWRGQDINVPFLQAVAKIEERGTFKLYGRVWAGPHMQSDTPPGTDPPAASGQERGPSSPQQGM